MAAIYDTMTGNLITGGLQGCNTCSVAIDTAIKIARERGCDVLLEDDDGEWIVHPDGSPADPHEPESDDVDE